MGTLSKTLFGASSRWQKVAEKDKNFQIPINQKEITRKVYTQDNRGTIYTLKTAEDRFGYSHGDKERVNKETVLITRAPTAEEMLWMMEGLLRSKVIEQVFPTGTTNDQDVIDFTAFNIRNKEGGSNWFMLSGDEDAYKEVIEAIEDEEIKAFIKSVTRPENDIELTGKRVVPLGKFLESLNSDKDMSEYLSEMSKKYFDI